MVRTRIFPLVLLMAASLASACDDTSASAKAADADAKPKADASAKGEVAQADDAKTDEPKAEAQPEGKVYGAPLTGAPTVTIAQVMDDPTAYENKVIRVEGLVVDVCTKRGCWFEMAGDRPGMKMRFKVRDGDMVFPPTAKGKRAVAEGKVTVKTMTLEQTRQYEEHMAEDAGRDFDPESVTEPMVIVMLQGKGAVIRDS